MSNEEMEKLWATQPGLNPTAVSASTLMRSIASELRLRGRMYAYQVFSDSFGLLILPLLAILGYRYDPVRNGGLYFVIPIVLWFWVLLHLVGTVRQWRRQRLLIRESAETVRSATLTALGSIEGEIGELRAPMTWAALVVFNGLCLAGSYIQFPPSRYDWRDHFGPVVGFVVLMNSISLFIIWLHYRRNLKPARARLRDVLQQL